MENGDRLECVVNRPKRGWQVFKIECFFFDSFHVERFDFLLDHLNTWSNQDNDGEWDIR